MRVIFILIFLLCELLSSKAFSEEVTEEDAFVTMRKIGNKILLNASDSTSWILPIEKRDKNSYLIRFHNAFAFTTESLVEAIHQQMEADNMPLTYLVQVFNCDNKVIYSYKVLRSIHDSDIPCLKRNPPKACYYILIKWDEYTSSATISYSHFFWIPVFIALFLIARSIINKRKRDLVEIKEIADDSEFMPIGGLKFYPQKQIIKYKDGRIELSSKEARLLAVFAARPNEIIDRDKLMKEVWEDDGVFVGRSLDVFVSKLRKKLQSDSDVKLINIHGKGYKLQIG